MQGIVIINKEKGYTSQDVVSKVKKILNIKKAGHTGTLDPMATGVLPVLLESYTKLSKYLIEHDKKYLVKLKLGEKKDTGDSEGNSLKKESVDVNILEKENINRVLNSFIGESKQVPPLYSAIKVNGKKLYQYAREGKEISVEPRNITIYEIKLINIFSKNIEIEFEVKCSKGTYIRSLCEDIANKLGTVGYMCELKRLSVDKFDISDSITLEELENNKNNELFLKKRIISANDFLLDLPQIVLNKRKEELFLNGVKLNYNLSDGIYNIFDFNNNYIGTGIVKNNLLKRDVILAN